MVKKKSKTLRQWFVRTWAGEGSGWGSWDRKEPAHQRADVQGAAGNLPRGRCVLWGGAMILRFGAVWSMAFQILNFLKEKLEIKIHKIATIKNPSKDNVQTIQTYLLVQTRPGAQVRLLTSHSCDHLRKGRTIEDVSHTMTGPSWRRSRLQ